MKREDKDTDADACFNAMLDELRQRSSKPPLSDRDFERLLHEFQQLSQHESNLADVDANSQSSIASTNASDIPMALFNTEQNELLSRCEALSLLCQAYAIDPGKHRDGDDPAALSRLFAAIDNVRLALLHSEPDAVLVVLLQRRLFAIALHNVESLISPSDPLIEDQSGRATLCYAGTDYRVLRLLEDPARDKSRDTPETTILMLRDDDVRFALEVGAVLGIQRLEQPPVMAASDSAYLSGPYLSRTGMRLLLLNVGALRRASA